MNSIMQHAMVNQISRRCIMAAHELLDLVHDNRFTGGIALPAWWYEVFCEFPPCIYTLKRM